MNKLLRTNFMRLWKDKVFWGSIAIMVIGALYKTISLLSAVNSGGEATLSNVFFDYTEYVLILVSVFCSLYIGTEYSDGTMRNKIIMGYSRTNIYCANLIVSITAMVILCIAHIVPSLIGVSLGFAVSVADTLIGILCSFALVCSITATFNMIAMLSKQKTVAVVICIVLDFLLLLYANVLRNDVAMARQNGEPNLFYEFLYAFLPHGQALQLSLEPEMFNVTPPALRILYAGILFVLTTGIGLALFNRKDLE